MVVGHLEIDHVIILPRDGALSVGTLRVNYFLEQHVLFAFGFNDFVPYLQLGLQHGIGRFVKLDALLFHFIVVFGVAVDRFPAHLGAGRLHSVVNDRLQLRRQGVVLGLVEKDFELLAALVEALQHAVFDHVREAQQTVGSGVVELGGIDQAAIQRWHDFAARQWVDRGSHRGEDVHRQADRAKFKALHIRHFGDRLLEPAQRLGGHGAIQVRHHVHVQGFVDFVQQRLATAKVVPCQHHVGVHAKRRARAPQRKRVVLAVVVGHHAVAAVQRALVDRLQQLECRHHGARWQHFNFELAARHIVDFFGKVVGILVKDVFGGPGALEAK